MITSSSKSYELCRTQFASSNTVFAIQICSVVNSSRATADCFGSSPVSSRTSTLVSTAFMATLHLAADSCVHVGERFGFAFLLPAASHLVDSGPRKSAGWPQENAILSFLNGELSTRSPGARGPDFLGQDEL